MIQLASIYRWARTFQSDTKQKSDEAVHQWWNNASLVIHRKLNGHCKTYYWSFTVVTAKCITGQQSKAFSFLWSAQQLGASCRNHQERVRGVTLESSWWVQYTSHFLSQVFAVDLLHYLAVMVYKKIDTLWKFYRAHVKTSSFLSDCSQENFSLSEIHFWHGAWLADDDFQALQWCADWEPDSCSCEFVQDLIVLLICCFWCWLRVQAIWSVVKFHATMIVCS